MLQHKYTETTIQKLNVKKAIKRTLTIFNAADNSPDADEPALLLLLVKYYNDKRILIPYINPIELIKIKMQEECIKAKDLEPILGNKGHVSSILSGHREITLKTAQRLKKYFKLPAEIFLPST